MNAGPSRLVILGVSILCGIVAAVMVSKVMRGPFQTLEQKVFAPGEADVVVKANPGDWIAGQIRPGQFVDVVAPEEAKPNAKKTLRLLVEKVQVVAVAEPPASEMTLRMSKQQMEELKPLQDAGTLRFIVRQNEEKK